jgi:hypothetical protein
MPKQRPVNNTASFHFLTPVWGKDFVTRYVNIFLPAQLPNLHNFSGSVYKIITRPEDAAIIRSSDAFKKLSSIMEPQLIFGLEDTSNNYRRMSHGYEIGMRGAPSLTPFVFLTPDSIWSLGSFDKLKELLTRGYNAVLVPGFRVTLESFLNDFRAYPDGISGRQLCMMAEKHMHNQFRSFIWGEKFHNIHPAAIYWRVTGGFVARHFVLHPLMVRAAKPIDAMAHTLDYDMATCIRRSEIYICTDSDEIFGIDAALKNHCRWSIKPGPVTEEDILVWFAGGWPNKFHRWLGEHTLYIHSGDIGESHRNAARESSQCIKRIYKRMALSVFFHSPWKETKKFIRSAPRKCGVFLFHKTLNFARRRKSFQFLSQKLRNLLRREAMYVLQPELDKIRAELDLIKRECAIMRDDQHPGLAHETAQHRVELEINPNTNAVRKVRSTAKQNPAARRSPNVVAANDGE